MDRLHRELTLYGQKDYYPFHMPGHKRNKGSVDDEFPFERDITEIEGFDNLHHAEGILKEGQEAVTKLYGSKESFYSINGSTAALLAAVSAAVPFGGEILVARNCHKAVYHAICLRGLKPTYLYPQYEDTWWINGGILPEDVEQALSKNSSIKAVLITSPTYDGVVSDIEKIAEIAHRYEIPLIVDEAHGAHFCFSDYFPVSAGDLGADLVIHSFHKTLPSMTQTAVLHRFTDRVESRLLHRFMGIYQSSSPSYILMASIDACVDKLEKDRESMFAEFTENLENARKELSNCNCIRLASPQKGSSGVFDFDRSKLIFSTKDSTLTGVELSRILLEKYHIQIEMESEYYALALSAVGDTAEGFARLCRAIQEIDENEKFKVRDSKPSQSEKTSAEKLVSEQVMTPGEALEAESKVSLLEDSVGQISAEFGYLYPPGIPLIVPGERITGQFVRNVRIYMEKSLYLQGLEDYTNKTIRVTSGADRE